VLGGPGMAATTSAVAQPASEGHITRHEVAGWAWWWQARRSQQQDRSLAPPTAGVPDGLGWLVWWVVPGT
jgi:hypothetical protein